MDKEFTFGKTTSFIKDNFKMACDTGSGNGCMMSKIITPGNIKKIKNRAKAQ